MRIVFKIHFSMNNKIHTFNAYNSILIKTCRILWIDIYLTNLNKMYPKFTGSSRVLSYPLEILVITCSTVGVHILPIADSNSIYKTFFCSSIKRQTNKKKNMWVLKVLNYLQLHYICMRFLCSSQSCLWFDIRSRVKWNVQYF